MSRLLTVFGGSGFVGRYIVRRMAGKGWRVRVAVRRPNEALFVRPYGTVGQVEPVLANVRDERTVAAAMSGSDAVMNCVGILAPSGANDFDSVQAQAPGRIARIAAQLNIPTMVHLSAIGADPSSDSVYSQTKAQGEEAVHAHMPQSVILRPSVVFGAEDRFFNRFAGMARYSPVLPIVGATTRFQPIYVDDVARAAVRALTEDVTEGIYELGGPETKSFAELMDDMLSVIRRKRVILNLPFGIAGIMAFGLDMAESASFGLFANTVLTRDQLRNLRCDNVVSGNHPGLAELGVEPTMMMAVFPDYLWRYRPSGQYSAILESAGNLRN